MRLHSHTFHGRAPARRGVLLGTLSAFAIGTTVSVAVAQPGQPMGVDRMPELIAAWGPCPSPCAFDLTGDGFVDVSDFNVLNAQLALSANGSVPEPSALQLLFVVAAVALLARRRRRHVRSAN